MASTITIPAAGDIGAFASEVSTGLVRQGSFDSRVANALIDVATAAVADVNALQAGTSVGTQVAAARNVRGVVTSNVADLAAFTVAGNDGLTYAANEELLLGAQTTGAESGPYVVGAVGSGTAPLTRPSWWAAASVQPKGAQFNVNEGTAWAGSQWFATLAGNITVGTSAPAFYPRRHKVTTGNASGTPGVATISTLFMLSAAVVSHSRKTTGGTPGHTSITTQTAGAGNGTVTITSTGNETSTFNVVVHNG